MICSTCYNPRALVINHFISVWLGVHVPFYQFAVSFGRLKWACTLQKDSDHFPPLYELLLGQL